MNARSHEQEDTGLEEYEFLYIAPPEPSRNWRPPSRIRWTNLALAVTALAVSLALLVGAFHAGRALVVWLR